jgi:hypothetical protein
MESIESVILTLSITVYHSEGPPIFNRNADSQRAFVIKTDPSVINAPSFPLSKSLNPGKSAGLLRICQLWHTIPYSRLR